MKLITQLIVVAVLAGLAYGGWQYREQIPGLSGDKQVAKKKRGGRPALVEVKKARAGEVVVTVEAVGTAQANEAVIVTAQATGLVKKIHFTEGQWVKKGTTLIEMDSSELQAELAEKRANLDNAIRLYERAKKLLRTRNTPEARVEELFGQVEAAEARVRADEARIAETVVTAPFAGRLGLRRISVGTLIRPGDQITTLDDTSRIKVDFRVPETALAHVRQGQGVRAASAAYPGREFRGKVATIGTRVDPVTRSIEIRARFDNRDGDLRPGMFLAARLVATVRAWAVLIPEEALIASGDKRFVFAVIEGKAAHTEVTIGEQVKGDVEILTGLAAGVSVVVGGVQKVRPGQAVKVLPPGGFKKGVKPGAKKNAGPKKKPAQKPAA